MSEHDHHHHPDCDCHVTEFVLDHDALQAYARSIGITKHVEFHCGEVDQTPTAIDILDMDNRVISARYAGTWTTRWWFKHTLVSHHIYVQAGLPAGETCELLRHELQHALQAECCKRPYRKKRGSFEDYLADPDEEDAREAAEEEWRDLGHCLLAT